MAWLTGTLQHYPEIAIFLSLAIGYWVGGKSFKGFSLGAVTATLLAAIAIGQLQITISPNVKSGFFRLYLIAVGYGVGAAVRLYAASRKTACRRHSLAGRAMCAVFSRRGRCCPKVAGYDLGSKPAGLFAGSQG